jgi:hypothetical protein
VLYAVDLGAAALGALAPARACWAPSAPRTRSSSGALCAAAAWAVAPPGDRTRARAVAMAVASLVVALGARGSDAGLVIRYPKGLPARERETPTFEAWTPLAYVRLGPLPGRCPHWHLWSPSPNTPPGMVEAADATLDGEAATPVYAVAHALRSSTSSASTPPPRPTCSAPPATPASSASAAAATSSPPSPSATSTSTARRSTPASSRCSTPSAPLAHLDDPRVTVRLGDGRALYARSRVHCSVLQASLVDTWAATSAGAFAHTEATLYTREAWSIFLRRVAPTGVLTFSRWYDPRRVSETARLVALAVASLHDRGVARPREHLALLAAGNVATILVSPAPFTPADIAALHDLETRSASRLLVTPDRPRDRAPARRHPRRPRRRGPRRRRPPLGLDTSAPTDERPFFFQLLAPARGSTPSSPSMLARGSPASSRAT